MLHSRELHTISEVVSWEHTIVLLKLGLIQGVGQRGCCPKEFEKGEKGEKVGKSGEKVKKTGLFYGHSSKLWGGRWV